MANEAVCIEKLGYPPGEPIQITVSGGIAITKGTLMYLTDARSGAASSLSGQAFIGVANSDKTATDGATRIGVDTKGVWDMTSVAGADMLPVAGQYVEMSGANLIRRAGGYTQDISGMALIVGKALETASASEVIAVKLGF